MVLDDAVLFLTLHLHAYVYGMINITTSDSDAACPVTPSLCRSNQRPYSSCLIRRLAPVLACTGHAWKSGPTGPPTPVRIAPGSVHHHPDATRRMSSPTEETMTGSRSTTEPSFLPRWDVTAGDVVFQVFETYVLRATLAGPLLEPP
jgi:hypothetical protein